jgi:L-alanine-DL-glutamate epimerase-like enolase superfamily enzyme
VKIQSARARTEALALTRPYTIATGTISAVELSIVELRAGGLLGLGAASPAEFVTGESDAACRAALEDLEWLVGRDARALPQLARELARRMPATPAARAALDIALHDLLAQKLGVPLVEMLGRAHEALPTSITIGIKPTAEALAEAREYLERGFRVLKIKLGHVLEEDIERVTKLRELVGPGVTLRVDPNQGYTPASLTRFVERTARLDIEFLEQPLPAKDVDALRALPAALRARVAADESLLDERDALELVRPSPACGIFNIKLMKCGGIAPARGIARIAELAGVRLMWGCMDESRISIAAALHAALASPATRYLDLDGSFDLERDVVSGGFTVQDGILRTVDAPGLGVTAL